MIVCAECDFWDVDPEGAKRLEEIQCQRSMLRSAGVHGVCRLNAPVPGLAVDALDRTGCALVIWPLTSAHEWCAEGFSSEDNTDQE